MAESDNVDLETISPEEKKLLSVLRTLDISPDMDSDNVARIARAFRGSPEDSTKQFIPKMTSHGYPKFSIFFGEEGKGEANFETFKYEVQSVIADNIYTLEQVMFGIRRCLKGLAADKLRRLGPGVTPELVLQKLECDYGTIENRETVLRKLYTCEQKHGENIETFASRIEEFFYKAVELRAFHASDTDVLKQILHSGLRSELKQITIYQRDTIESYDIFKRELRRIEIEIGKDNENRKPSKPVVEKKENDSEMTQLLRQINERIERLEAKSKDNESINETQQGYGRGSYSNRGNRGNNRGRNRGGGNNSRRPLGSNTFTPTCYICNEKGHVQTNCPTIIALMFCSNCKQKGHVRKTCPNL